MKHMGILIAAGWGNVNWRDIPENTTHWPLAMVLVAVGTITIAALLVPSLGQSLAVWLYRHSADRRELLEFREKLRLRRDTAREKSRETLERNGERDAE